MYRLTVVSGPNRGTSFKVEEGETSLGRKDSTILLNSLKVSKRHCVLIVRGKDITVKDLGSSNGTFINGMLTKERKIVPGDRISAGEFVLELSELSESPLPQAEPLSLGSGPDSGVSLSTPSPEQTGPPADLRGRLIWYFNYRVMPYFYNFMLKTEWRVVCAYLFGVFILVNILIIVSPLIEQNRISLVHETARRAKFIARQITEQNAAFLAAHTETNTDVGLAEHTDGVRTAVLLDLDNRILAPQNRMNQYFTEGEDAAVAVRASRLFRNGREMGYWEEVGSSAVVAVEPVKVLSPSLGKNVVVAMAVVSIETSLVLPDLGEIGVIYSQALIQSGLIGALILLILYRLTLKPLDVLNDDMDKALKGQLAQVTHDYKFEELNPLWELINSAIQRIPRSADGGGGMGDSLGASPDVEEFSGPLKMIGAHVNFGFGVLDWEKKVVYLNPILEEITGIRLDNAMGQPLSTVVRDQSMEAFMKDLLDRALPGGEGASEDYEFSGIAYKVYGAAFGSAAQNAKCYIIAALREEGG